MSVNPKTIKNSSEFTIWFDNYITKLLKNRRYSDFDEIMSNFDNSKIPEIRNSIIESFFDLYKYRPNLFSSPFTSIEFLYQKCVDFGILDSNFDSLNLY